MSIELLSLEDLRAHAGARLGVESVASPDAVAEVTRCELFALGQTLRWVLARRVVNLFSVLGATPEGVEESLRTLEAAGDLSAGPSGEVSSAPLRAICPHPGHWLFAGTLPSSDLSARLGAPVTGTPRRLHVAADERVVDAVVNLGGRVLAVEQWAGLGRHPPVGEWLAVLAARLETAGRFSERAGALSWTALEVYQPAARRWKLGPLGDTPTLVRARQPGGWVAHGWTHAPNGTGTPELIPLTADEARRTRFALEAAAGTPLRFETTREGESVIVALPAMLPAAEYRYLAAAGPISGTPRRVRLPGGMFEKAAGVLRERLGVVVGA